MVDDIASLALERINILEVNQLDVGRYAVSFEYQYTREGEPRTWHKMVIVVSDLGNIVSKIRGLVLQVREEIQG